MACLLHDGISRRPEKKRSDQSDPNLPVKCWQWNSSPTLSSQHSGLSPSTGAHVGHEVAQTILGAYKESLVGDASTFGCNPGTRGMAGGTTTLAPPSALAFMISSMFGTTLDLLEPRRNSPISPGHRKFNYRDKQLTVHQLKKTSAQQIQGAAFRRQRMYGLRSAKRWYASIFSSWPWHGVAYLSWHFSEATQEQRSIDQFIYKPWHCKYKY